MVIINQTKSFKNKSQRIEYINSRIKNFTRKQKRDSDLSNLFKKRNDELDYIIQNIYKQRLKAVTIGNSEKIVTTKQANLLYKDTPQFQEKIKRNASRVNKTGNMNRLFKDTNALAIHLTNYGFTPNEAIWLVSKFGFKMAKWHLQVASGEKEEIFNDVTDPNFFIERWIE